MMPISAKNAFILAALVSVYTVIPKCSESILNRGPDAIFGQANAANLPTTTETQENEALPSVL